MRWTCIKCGTSLTDEDTVDTCNDCLSSMKGQAIAQPAEQVSPSATGCRGATAPSNPEADSSVRCRDKAASAADVELYQAKVKLYGCLLRKPAKELTDSEINIGYELARDAEIQALLQKSLAADAAPCGQRARLGNGQS